MSTAIIDALQSKALTCPDIANLVNVAVYEGSHDEVTVRLTVAESLHELKGKGAVDKEGKLWRLRK